MTRLNGLEMLQGKCKLPLKVGLTTCNCMTPANNSSDFAKVLVNGILLDPERSFEQKRNIILGYIKVSVHKLFDVFLYSYILWMVND